MTLTFGGSVTLGSLRYETHASTVRVTLGLAPRAGSARITFPPAVAVEAAPGAAAAVVLHGEERDVSVLGGVVLRVEHHHDRTVVVVGDALARLAALRPASTFQQQAVADVVSAIASAGAIPTGALDAGLEVLTYVADQHRTALEHVAVLAGWSGAVATSDPEGALELLPLPTGPADLALRVGREVASLDVRRSTPAPDTIWTGVGPAGNVAAPDAHLETTGVLPDGAPAPAVRTVRRVAPALRTPDAVTTATSASATRNATARVRAACWLQPRLRPGLVVEVADAPQPGGIGPWFVTSVTHELGPRGRGTTRFEGERLAADGGLLDALLGAVGGLL